MDRILQGTICSTTHRTLRVPPLPAVTFNALLIGSVSYETPGVVSFLQYTVVCHSCDVIKVNPGVSLKNICISV